MTDPTQEPVSAPLRRLGVSLLTLGRIRLELLAIEAQEEKERVAGLMLWAVMAALLAGFEQSGARAMGEILSRSRDRATAVFCANDMLAVGAMVAARAAGLSVPDDIAIAGFDNVPQSAFTTPPLTTVAQSTAEQGRAAARMLLDRIENRATDVIPDLCLECRLIVRGSTNANWKTQNLVSTHA